MGGRPGLAHPAVAVHQQPARDLGQPDVEERERVDLVPEHMPAIGLAVESAGRHPGVEVGGVTGTDLEDVRDVQPQQPLHALVSRHPHVAYTPQFVPCRGVALECTGEVGVAGRRPGRPHQRVADRRIPRGVERHHLLDPRRRALLHVEGENLLDIVLHLIQPPLDLEALICGEHPRAGRVADVQIRLPGLGLQRDHLWPKRPRGNGVQVAALQLPVAGDTAIAHPAVDRRDDLDVPRPVLRNQRPLDPRVVRIAHADEPAAVQCHLPAAEITETNLADDSRVPDVQFVSVTEQIHLGEPDRLPALEAQLEDQPVRHVNKILVEHGHAAQDRRLAVVTAVYVGTGIMHAVGVFPLHRAARAQVAVPC